MKKIFIVGLFSILFAFTSQAQKVYSVQNLGQMSQENLNVLLKKAKQNTTVGIVFTGIGVASVASLFILASTGSNMSLEAAGIIFVGGSVTTLAGLPLLIVNSSRVNKIKNVLSDRVSIEVAPCRFHNYMAHTCQSGATLRIKF